jgi:hypothetical protein
MRIGKKKCKRLQGMVKDLHKEIIVFKDFEVEDGVLGLGRDVYLSIVKFLDSQVVRKV